MENEKMIIEMLQNITTELQEVKAELRDLKAEMRDLKAEKREMKVEMQEIKQSFDNLGQLYTDTVLLQQRSDTEITKTLKYLSHKVAEHDEEIFHMLHKQ